VTSGLWIASGLVIALALDRTPVQFFVTVAVLVVALALDLNPVWLLLGAGAIGAIAG
jgi:hypothetical protein